MFILFYGRRLHFSTEGVYIFPQKAFTFFHGRRLHFSTEGVYIFLRKAFTFFYGRRLHFSTEGVYIFLRKVQDFYGKVRFIKNGAPFPKKRLDYLHRISISFYGRCEPPGPP